MSHIATNPSKKVVKLFACPFFQRDQFSFGHGKWKLCAHGSWKAYHRVREHIFRKHTLPTNHCDRCFEDLKDSQALLQHRSQSQCEQKALLYTTTDRIFKLRIPMKRGIEEFEKWKNMYRILFPKDIRIPSPFKNELSYNTEELRAMATKIERICNSPSSDIRAQMEQIRNITEQAIRYIENVTSIVQYDPQEVNEANNATGREIVAHNYDETPDMPSTPGLGLWEYMELSNEFMSDQISGVSSSVLSSQDDPTSQALYSSYNIDTDLSGIEFQY